MNTCKHCGKLQSTDGFEVGDYVEVVDHPNLKSWFVPEDQIGTQFIIEWIRDDDDGELTSRNGNRYHIPHSALKKVV